MNDELEDYAVPYKDFGQLSVLFGLVDPFPVPQQELKEDDDLEEAFEPRLKSSDPRILQQVVDFMRSHPQCVVADIRDHVPRVGLPYSIDTYRHIVNKMVDEGKALKLARFKGETANRYILV